MSEAVVLVKPPLAGVGGAKSVSRCMATADTPSGSRAYFGYDASSNQAKKRLGNGVTAYFSYDKAERLTGLRGQNGQTIPIQGECQRCNGLSLLFQRWTGGAAAVIEYLCICRRKK
jgi:hypothetical protein